MTVYEMFSVGSTRQWLECHLEVYKCILHFLIKTLYCDLLLSYHKIMRHKISGKPTNETNKSLS